MAQPEYEGKAWDVWMEELGTKSPSTQRVYLRNFKLYLERWGCTPEELYETRRADLGSGDPRDRKNVERKVRMQMSELLEKGLAPSSVRQVSKSVASFLEAQGLDLKLKARDQPRIITNGQSLALAKEIRVMWDEVSSEMRERNRALLAVLKDSGLRVSDVGLMDLEDWERARILEVDGERFKVFDTKATKKTGELAYIHLGPEAVEAVDTYLEVRDSPSPALFVDRHGKRISDSALSRQLKDLGMKTGNDKVSGHSLRKFHTTKLEGAGMPEGWVKRLQGKKASVYSHPEETGELTTKYVECYHALRIFGEQASAQKIDEQATEIEALRRKVGELEGYKAGLKKEILEEVRKELRRIKDLP